MPQTQNSQLPFVDDFHVDIQIRVQSTGRRFTADIQANRGKWHRIQIPLTIQDVEDLNSELQEAIQNTTKLFEEETHVEPDKTSNGLLELARKGREAFNRIFPKGIPRTVIQNALQEGNAIIQISAEDFFIPWELLFDGELENHSDIGMFWGLRHIISRTIIQDARLGDFASPVIEELRPRIGLIAYSNLEHVRGKEIPFLTNLRRQRRIFLSRLRSLDDNDKENGLRYFGNFLEKEIQIAHLACHAFQKRPISQSALLVSDDFNITIGDFRRKEFDIKHNPLVILNACLTGTMNPLYTSNWASLFWEYGARGVLATEFKVPDWFAFVFIEQLYKRFLSGTPLGQSVLETRQAFWKQSKNPLGLAYALYSSPSIRLQVS